MPQPVSLMAITAVIVGVKTTSVVLDLPASGVNLIAFDRTLSTTCFSFQEVARNLGAVRRHVLVVSVMLPACASLETKAPVDELINSQTFDRRRY